MWTASRSFGLKGGGLDIVVALVLLEPTQCRVYKFSRGTENQCIVNNVVRLEHNTK